MRSIRPGWQGVLGSALLLLLPACGGDGGGDQAQQPLEPCGGGVDASGCGQIVAPGEDDYATIQNALVEAESNSSVCLCPGEYSVKKELNATQIGLTIRGLGATRADVMLDFADMEGDDGLTATGDDFTIEKLSVKNTPGDGIEVKGVKNVTFRDLKVSWDAGSVTENGAYAVYPVESDGILVEDCEVVGAADAAIYVGQGKNAVIRNNVAHGNVLGIEIENTLGAEVYDNEAYDNTAGIAVFLLPFLTQKEATGTLVRDNLVHDNNRANFGEPGTTVANVPPGIGVLVMASDEQEVRNNTIEDNDSSGVVVLSIRTLELLTSQTPDPETDAFPETTYVHDNDFSGNGQKPSEPFALFGVETLEDVVWDGFENADNPDGAELCLGTSSLPSFRDFNMPDGLSDHSKQSTDTTPHECELPPLPGIDLGR